MAQQKSMATAFSYETTEGFLVELLLVAEIESVAAVRRQVFFLDMTRTRGATLTG
jgi:hypothetical protein